jgi:hypothetical protein
VRLDFDAEARLRLVLAMRELTAERPTHVRELLGVDDFYPYVTSGYEELRGALRLGLQKGLLDALEPFVARDIVGVFR